MSGATSCTAVGCHPGVTTSGSITHVDIDCNTSGCHNGEFGTGLQPYDTSDHIGAPCTYCHTATYPSVPQHTDAELDLLHEASIAGCTDCHEVSLISEHEKDPAFLCQTCHSSTDPVVLAAIAAWDATCDACHDLAGSHQAAHDGGLAGTTGCDATGCHVDNISTQHGGVCATCHDSTDPLVIAAIATGDVTCDACHVPLPDHEAAHDGGLAGTTGCDATGCHVDNISTQHGDVCATCHASADPLVVAAIAAGDVTCDACHDIASSHEAAHDGGLAGTTGCDATGCHVDNISTQHGGVCATCHDSTDPLVIAAIATGDVTCDACHVPLPDP